MATSMYARGRSQEYNVVNKFKKWGIRAIRVLLSGQRGEGDVLVTIPTDDEGIFLRTEVKARKSVPKTVYEWLGKHDLLVMKKIGQKYDWLVTMKLDRYLELLAQLNHNVHTSDNTPKSDREDDGSVIL